MCPEAAAGDIATQERAAVVSDITLIAGAGAAAAGLVWMLVDNGKARRASPVAVSVAPDFSGGASFTLEGTF